MMKMGDHSTRNASRPKPRRRSVLPAPTKRSNSSATRAASSGGAGTSPDSVSSLNRASAREAMVRRRAGLNARRPQSRLLAAPPSMLMGWRRGRRAARPRRALSGAARCREALPLSSSSSSSCLSFFSRSPSVPAKRPTSNVKSGVLSPPCMTGSLPSQRSMARYWSTAPDVESADDLVGPGVGARADEHSVGLALRPLARRLGGAVGLRDGLIGLGADLPHPVLGLDRVLRRLHGAVDGRAPRSRAGAARR